MRIPMNESANWYHFAVTTDAETLNVYHNGEKVDVDMTFTNGK